MHRHLTPARTRLAAVLASAVLGAAACGGTATKTASTATTPTTTSTTAPSTTAGGSAGGAGTGGPGTSTTSGATTTTASGGTGTTSTAAGIPSCASDGLRLAASGPSNPGAGSAVWTLTFTNTGQAPCTLTGYPGVSAITSSGHQIGQPAARTGAPSSTVVVQPGQSASAGVRIAQAGNFPPGACGTPTAAFGFRAYPPGQTASLTAPASSLSICSGSAVQMQVNPLTS